MNEQTEKLKPCPFCGDSQFSEVDMTFMHATGPTKGTRVKCQTCGAQACDFVWNTRAALDSAPLPVGRGDESGCVCHSCNTRYQIDITVEDSLWAQIKPEAAETGAGLLCPRCIVDRLMLLHAGVFAHFYLQTPADASNCQSCTSKSAASDGQDGLTIVGEGQAGNVAYVYKIRGGYSFNTIDVAALTDDDNFWRNRDDGEYELLSITAAYDATALTEAKRAGMLEAAEICDAELDGIQGEAFGAVLMLRDKIKAKALRAQMEGK